MAAIVRTLASRHRNSTEALQENFATVTNNPSRTQWKVKQWQGNGGNGNAFCDLLNGTMQLECMGSAADSAAVQRALGPNRFCAHQVHREGAVHGARVGRAPQLHRSVKAEKVSPAVQGAPRASTSPIGRSSRPVRA